MARPSGVDAAVVGLLEVNDDSPFSPVRVAEVSTVLHGESSSR